MDVVGGGRCFYVILLIYWDSVQGQAVGSPDTACVLSQSECGGAGGQKQCVAIWKQSFSVDLGVT